MTYHKTIVERGGRRGATESRRRPRLQPTLQALEDRKLLSTIVVNNPTDTPVTGEMDLREAIVQANTSGGNETITFDSKVFKTPQTITLDPTLGQLELSDTTGTETITGPAVRVTVSALGASRVFQIDGGVVASISGLTISGGKVTGNGGGLYNHGGGTIALSNCAVSGNSATRNGGGLYNRGNITLTNCTVSGNSASRNGAGMYDARGSSNTLTNCTISSNSAARAAACKMLTAR